MEPSSTHFSLPTGERPLGIQHPLLPGEALGQSMLQPKFLTPLGVHALTVLNPAVFTSQKFDPSDETAPYEHDFFDTPEPTPPAIAPNLTTPTPESPEIAPPDGLPAIQPQLNAASISTHSTPVASQSPPPSPDQVHQERLELPSARVSDALPDRSNHALTDIHPVSQSLSPQSFVELSPNPSQYHPLPDPSAIPTSQTESTTASLPDDLPDVSTSPHNLESNAQVHAEVNHQADSSTQSASEVTSENTERSQLTPLSQPTISRQQETSSASPPATQPEVSDLTVSNFKISTLSENAANTNIKNLEPTPPQLQEVFSPNIQDFEQDFELVENQLQESLSIDSKASQDKAPEQLDSSLENNLSLDSSLSQLDILHPISLDSQKQSSSEPAAIAPIDLPDALPMQSEPQPASEPAAIAPIDLPDALPMQSEPQPASEPAAIAPIDLPDALPTQSEPQPASEPAAIAPIDLPDALPTQSEPQPASEPAAIAPTFDSGLATVQPKSDSSVEYSTPAPGVNSRQPATDPSEGTELGVLSSGTPHSEVTPSTENLSHPRSALPRDEISASPEISYSITEQPDTRTHVDISSAAATLSSPSTQPTSEVSPSYSTLSNQSSVHSSAQPTVESLSSGLFTSDRQDRDINPNPTIDRPFRTETNSTETNSEENFDTIHRQPDSSTTPPIETLSRSEPDATVNSSIESVPQVKNFPQPTIPTERETFADTNVSALPQPNLKSADREFLSESLALGDRSTNRPSQPAASESEPASQPYQPNTAPQPNLQLKSDADLTIDAPSTSRTDASQPSADLTIDAPSTSWTDASQPSVAVSVQPALQDSVQHTQFRDVTHDLEFVPAPTPTQAPITPAEPTNVQPKADSPITPDQRTTESIDRSGATTHASSQLKASNLHSEATESYTDSHVTKHSSFDVKKGAQASNRIDFNTSQGKVREAPQDLPPLPTTIQNLSILEPLTQLQTIQRNTQLYTNQPSTSETSDLESKLTMNHTSAIAPLIPHSPSTKTDTSQIANHSVPRTQSASPEEWSTIADLFQASSSMPAKTNTLANKTSEEWSTIAEQFSSATPAQTTLPDLQRAESASAESDLMGYPDLNLAQLLTPTIATIQRDRVSSTPEYLSTVEPMPEDPTPSELSALSASPEHLERLAQEVYRLVRYRLALERERWGH